ATLLLDLVDAPGGPCVDRRGDIAEGPFVSGALTAPGRVTFAGHEGELLFCGFAIDQRPRDGAKKHVPPRTPRVLRFVRHRDYVGVVDVSPVAIAAGQTLGGRARLPGIALKPVVDYVVIKLLRPEHAGECLPHDVLRIRREIAGDDGRVKFVRL